MEFILAEPAIQNIVWKNLQNLPETGRSALNPTKRLKFYATLMKLRSVILFISVIFPRIVKSFILQHANIFCGKRILIIVTMGLFSGDGAGLAARLLKRCGADVTGGLHIRMPDCIADVKLLKKTPSENAALISAAQKKIMQTAEYIKRGRYPKDGLSFFHLIAGLFGQRLWFKLHAKELREHLNIRTERCIGCGICAANCPSKSLYIENNKAVFYPGSCTICYRCINNCPAKAIILIGKEIFEQCRFENYIKDL